MAKKKSNEGLQLLTFLAILLGFVAAVMIFFDSLYYELGNSSENRVFFTGLEVAFGKDLATISGLVSAKLDFNILVILAYGLPLIGTIVMALIKNKLGYLMSAIAFIAGAVLLGVMPEYVTISTDSIIGNLVNNVDWQHSVATIIAIVASGLAGLLSIFLIVKE